MAVVVVESADDVIEAMRFARDAGLRVAPQATGHNARPLGDLGGTLLVRTSALREVTLDRAGNRARVGAGALWQDVTEPAGELGFAALAGSSPDVGVVGTRSAAASAGSRAATAWPPTRSWASSS